MKGADNRRATIVDGTVNDSKSGGRSDIIILQGGNELGLGLELGLELELKLGLRLTYHIPLHTMLVWQAEVGLERDNLDR